MVAPFPLRPRLFRFAKRALVTSGTRSAAHERRASVCGSAAGVALRLRFAKRSSPLSAPLSPLADRRPKLISKITFFTRSSDFNHQATSHKTKTPLSDMDQKEKHTLKSNQLDASIQPGDRLFYQL